MLRLAFLLAALDHCAPAYMLLKWSGCNGWRLPPRNHRKILGAGQHGGCAEPKEDHLQPHLFAATTEVRNMFQQEIAEEVAFAHALDILRPILTDMHVQ